MRVLMSVVVCVLMQVGALSGPTRGVVGQERRGNTDARTRDAGTISIDTLSLPESAKSLKSLKSVAPHPLPVHVQPPLPVQTPVSHAVLTALTNVKGALGRVYGLQDSTLTQMASLHLLDSAINDSTYHGVYMTMIGTTWEVRVAESTDLLQWKYLRTIIPNADMPYARTVASNGWIVLVHEQWMRPGSTAPSRLGFKLYYNQSELLAGRAFNSFVAPLTVGARSNLEGTPNIYSAELVFRNGFYMVDAQIGFHYNDDAGVDQVAQGTLRSFGPTVVTPEWSAASATGYNAAFLKAGAIGNIGQRDAGVLGGEALVMQEGNIGHMPPTLWQDWRLWLYVPAIGEGFPPTGNGTITQLAPITDKGSTAFGNPSFKVIPCPANRTSVPTIESGRASQNGSDCVFVSFFAFGEGAAPGEAGVVAFYNLAP